MSDYCVVVLNGAHARLMTLEGVQFPEMEAGPNLIERERLDHSEGNSAPSELWSEQQSGGNRSPSGAAHPYDDHRGQHKDESNRRFARKVVNRIADIAAHTETKHIVVVAEKRMLGMVRDAVDPLVKRGLHVAELAKDLSRMDANAVHQYLARQQLLPQRSVPGRA